MDSVVNGTVDICLSTANHRREHWFASVAGHDRFELCDTEVEHLNGVAAALVRFEPDVVGFEIAVDDALRVGFVYGGADLFEDVDGPRDGEILLLFEDLAKRAAVEILHHEIRDLAFFRLRESEVGDINNVRMP